LFLELSVEELVSRARLHDADAFAELIQRFEGVALAVAYAQTRNAADAGDIVQEAFLRAWQRLDSLDDPSRFAHWISRMVRNLSIDLRRRRKALPLDESFDPPDSMPQTTSLERDEQKKQVERAINGLDDLSRECVTLRYYENMSSKQIADLLGITPAAVDMRLSRARNQLKDRLQKFVGEV
jgi:RNA polymerase sigma factor (sigma-70 family)